MDTIYVLWHKAPDTDSIVSSMLYAEYLNNRGRKAEVIKLWELNNETKYLLNLVWKKQPVTCNTLAEWTKIILTDHNDSSQSIDWREKLDIIEIIDHHNIWNIATKKPLLARFEPICSTCSIIYKIFKENNYNIDETTAKLLIWGIISDSLYFRSPTTTKEDIKIAKKLNRIAKIKDLQSFALGLFNAKSDLWDITAKEIVKTDYKEFEVSGIKYWVWVLETTSPDYSLNKEKEIVNALKEVKSESNLDFIMLGVIDILNEKATGIFPDESTKEIFKKAFNLKITWNISKMWRILSRKKQIVPLLNEYFSK